MKKFKISYLYSDPGMEGRRDQFPEEIITSPSLDIATYIYHIMYFPSFHTVTFNNYKEYPEYVKTWGLKIEEIINE